MKKIIIVFLSLFLTSVSSSQSINVDYRIVANAENLENGSSNENIPKEEVALFKSAFELINSMKMHLKANKNEAYYWGQNQLVNEENKMAYNIAKTIIANDKRYYTNLAQNIVFIQVEAFGETFIIKDSIDILNWKLTKEVKKIDGHVCYKALMSYKVSNMLGTFKKDVIAWYCPSIPYNFGPKNFAGLPGLILELTDDKFTYVVDKIKFSSKEIAIDPLTLGKIISADEFEDLATKAIEAKGFVLKKE